MITREEFFELLVVFLVFYAIANILTQIVKCIF